MSNYNFENTNVQGESNEEMFGGLNVANESDEATTVVSEPAAETQGEGGESSAPRTPAEILRGSYEQEKEHGLVSTPLTDAVFEMFATLLDISPVMRQATRLAKETGDDEAGLEIIGEAVAKRVAAVTVVKAELRAAGIL